MPVRKPIDWPECAAKLGAAVPRERLHPAVRAWAETSPKRERWLVAFSGGADSLALLLLLWAHWPERRDRLVAVHFNHRLRGAAADRDERFCTGVCAALNVKHVSGRWQKPPARASESQAREARHAFFVRQLGKSRARALWLGHQQDDVAETMLMRLARGSGSGGLAAPRPVQSMPEGRIHLRPLLGIKKSEIASLLRTCRATWREDRTNAGRDFLRGRVRRDVIPAWQEAAGGRDAIAGAALSRELIEEDDAALEAWLVQIAPFRSDGGLNLRRLRQMPRAVVRRALHRWLQQQGRGEGLSRQCFTTLLENVLQHRVTRQSLGTGAFAQIGRQRLKLVALGRKDRGQFQRAAN